MTKSNKAIDCGLVDDDGRLHASTSLARSCDNFDAAVFLATWHCIKLLAHGLRLRTSNMNSYSE